jgi:hypothetical protein
VAIDEPRQRPVGQMLDQRRERFGPRGIRTADLVGAVPEEDRRAVAVELQGGLAGEAGLADARLAGHQDRLALAGAHRLPAAPHALALLQAPDVALAAHAQQPR